MENRPKMPFLANCYPKCYPKQFLCHLVTILKASPKWFPTATQPFWTFFKHFDAKIPQKSHFLPQKVCVVVEIWSSSIFSVVQDLISVFSTFCHSKELLYTKWMSARFRSRITSQILILGQKYAYFDTCAHKTHVKKHFIERFSKLNCYLYCYPALISPELITIQ